MPTPLDRWRPFSFLLCGRLLSHEFDFLLVKFHQPPDALGRAHRLPDGDDGKDDRHACAKLASLLKAPTWATGWASQAACPNRFVSLA